MEGLYAGNRWGSVSPRDQPLWTRFSPKLSTGFSTGHDVINKPSNSCSSSYPNVTRASFHVKQSGLFCAPKSGEFPWHVLPGR